MNITTVRPATIHPPFQPGSRCTMLFNPPYHIMAAIIAFLIISINLFVMLLFVKNRALRRTPANYLLLSFSINDMLSGVSIVVHIVPFYYLLFNGCEESHRTFGSSYNIASGMISYSLLLVSIGHLLLLSSERFISLYYALRYQTLVTNFRIFTAAVIVWFVGSTATLIQLIWTLPLVREYTLENHKRYQIHNYYYIIVSIITLVLLPAVILITQYTWLFLLIRRLVQSAPGTTKTKSSLKERKALVIYCAMFICFLVCCVPLLVIKLIINVNIKVAETLPIQFLEGVFLLRYIVSFINPVLYTLYKRDFRKAVQMTIPLCKRSKTPDTTNGITMNSCYDINERDSVYSNNRFSVNGERRVPFLNNATADASYRENTHLLS